MGLGDFVLRFRYRRKALCPPCGTEFGYRVLPHTLDQSAAMRWEGERDEKRAESTRRVRLADTQRSITSAGELLPPHRRPNLRVSGSGRKCYRRPVLRGTPRQLSPQSPKASLIGMAIPILDVHRRENPYRRRIASSSSTSTSTSVKVDVQSFERFSGLVGDHLSAVVAYDSVFAEWDAVDRFGDESGGADRGVRMEGATCHRGDRDGAEVGHRKIGRFLSERHDYLLLSRRAFAESGCGMAVCANFWGVWGANVMEVGHAYHQPDSTAY